MCEVGVQKKRMRRLTVYIQRRNERFPKLKDIYHQTEKKKKKTNPNTVNPEEAKYLDNTQDKRKIKVTRNSLPAEV